MASPIRLLSLAGSLREASHNRAALRAAAELLPPDATLEITDLGGIPVCNQDTEHEPPAEVIELKAKNVSHVLVQRTAAERFSDPLARRLEKVKVGPATGPASDVGPVTDRRNALHIDKTVEEAISAKRKPIVQGDLVTEGSLA